MYGIGKKKTIIITITQKVIKSRLEFLKVNKLTNGMSAVIYYHLSQIPASLTINAQ